MKFLSVILMMALGLQAFSQAELNEYKYVIVPKKFDGFRSENQYQTSTLIKYYFVKQGFNTVYDDALPQDLNNNRCLGLKASIEDGSSMFATKVAIVLNDCQGNEVYRTMQGMSKVKDYNAAYRETISEAFISLNGFRHKYTPKEPQTAPMTISFKDDVKNLTVDNDTKEEMVPEVKEELPMVPSIPREITNDVKEGDDQIANEAQDVVIKITEVSQVVSKEEDTELALYAQQTPTGYQLVDTTPSIQFYLKETSVEGVYLAQGKNQKGLVFLEDNQWFFEYYEGTRRIKEVLLVKF